MRYLEEMASGRTWPDAGARDQNPLTPIEVLVTSCRRLAHQSQRWPEFRALPDQAHSKTVEELGYLKNSRLQVESLPAASSSMSDVSGAWPGRRPQLYRVRRSGNHRGSGTVRGPCTTDGPSKGDIYQHRIAEWLRRIPGGGCGSASLQRASRLADSSVDFE